MSKNDSIKMPLSIEKIIKDLKNVEIYLPNIIQPSIAGIKLYKKRKIQNKKVIEYQNEVDFNIIDNKLTTKNGETYEGLFGKKLKEIYLKKGIYIWPSGQKYIGSFSPKNVFEGSGKLIFKDKSEFQSEFSNGFPLKNGKFKIKLKDGANLYIQSNFKYDNNKVIFDEKTIIEIKKNNEKIYNFFGIFKKGKIIGDILINKKIDNNRFVEIRTFFKEGKIHGLMQIKDIKPGNTLQFMGEYKYGYRDGFFKIKDTINNIKTNEEFHDILYSSNKLKNILKKQNKDTLKLLKEFHKKKILEIKINKFIEKIKKVMKCFLKQYMNKLSFYLNQHKYLYLFNKRYKTNYNLEVEMIHINKIKLGDDGLELLCKICFPNLVDLSLYDVEINNFSLLKDANFPKLKILSLGQNNIKSIDFINSLPFKNLENILLGVNLIEEINQLKLYKSQSLKALFLLENKISDIKPLINLDTPNLEELYIGSNISDISPLINCKFPKLKQLSLSNNEIKNISSIIQFNFPNLELLILSNNKIEKINSLLKANFPKLNEISLKNNLLKDLNILPKLIQAFNKLNKLDISKNKFMKGSEDFNTTISLLKNKIENINY